MLAGCQQVLRCHASLHSFYTSSDSSQVARRFSDSRITFFKVVRPYQAQRCVCERLAGSLQIRCLRVCMQHHVQHHTSQTIVRERPCQPLMSTSPG